MPKHTSHKTGREGENPKPDADLGTSGGEVFSGQEEPGAEAALNEGAGTRNMEPEKAAGGPEAGQGADLPPDQRIAELEARITGLDTELAESKDQYLRKAADFENFRKRMNREKQDAIDFANQSLLLDLIPVLDDFDRALETAKVSAEQGERNAAASGEAPATPSKELKSFYEGFEMIAKRLSSTLETKWGLKSYVSAGEPFDPNRHEALMVEKSAELTEQIVQQDLLKGYTLKERVIRSAKVKVLVPDPGAASGSGKAGAEAETPEPDLDGQNAIKQEKE